MFESYFHVLFLGAIQGLTEFLPISSTAHLQLAQFMGIQAPNSLIFDAAVHLGTLIAVVVYFFPKLLALTRGFFRSFVGIKSPEASLSYQLMMASLPAIIIGFMLMPWLQGIYESPTLIAFNSIFFALVLGIIYYKYRSNATKTILEMSYKAALIVGLFQAVALFPGVSRSGATISAALILGFRQKDGAEFSFLMSIPIIFGATILIFLKAHTSNLFSLESLPLYFAGFLSAALVAWLAIFFFLKLIEKIGMYPFVVYRIILGLLVFAWVFYV